MPTFGPGNNCTDVSYNVYSISATSMTKTWQPPFELTRITRGAPVPKIVINASTGFPIPQAMLVPSLFQTILLWTFTYQIW